jgi:cytochrome c556
MKRLPILLGTCALLSISLLAAGASDQDVIDYRQDIMKTLDEQSEALSEIASTAIPNDNLNAHMEILALTASTALKAFEPKIPGGKAKPEVWSNWADFSKRMTEFAQRAAEGAQVAKEQGHDAALEAAVDAAESCKSCHDMYRQK